MWEEHGWFLDLFSKMPRMTESWIAYVLMLEMWNTTVTTSLDRVKIPLAKPAKF